MKDNELSVVNYYLEVLESGIDTKELAKNYAALNTKYNKLKVKSAKKIAQIEEELEASTKGLQNALKQLKKQQDEVVKPLIEQVKERETDV